MSRPLKLSFSLILFLFLSNHSIAQEKYPKPKAWLHVLVDKDTIEFGESFSLTLTYEVSDLNRVPVQFYEAGEQLLEIIKVFPSLGLIMNEGLENIVGTRVEDGLEGASTRYDIYRARITPLKSGALTIPSLSFQMKQFAMGQTLPADSLDQREGKLINAISAPLTIQVVEIKDSSKQSFFRIKGPLSISENLTNKLFNVGDTINYKVTISGPDVGLMLEMEINTNKNLLVSRNHIDYQDSMVSATEGFFSKTYYLSLIPTKSGTIRLEDIFKWPYVNEIRETQYIRPTSVVKVKGRRLKRLSKPNAESIFALDISESMQIQDYKPSRLFKGFELLEAYQKPFNRGKTLGFSGAVINLKAVPRDSSITKRAKRGTAIGNVIWLATQLMVSDTETKALIIVGDGDNTAGNVSVTAAAEYAKQNGVKIYTIGLGHTGRVPFGKDSFGRSNYVDNTFSEASFRLASEITGGKYYYFDDYESPEALMQIIYQEIHK